MKAVQKPSNNFNDVENEELKKENMVELAQLKIETNNDEYFESETAEMSLGKQAIEIDDLKQEKNGL